MVTYCGACGLPHDIKMSCELAKKENERSRAFFAQFVTDKPPMCRCVLERTTDGEKKTEVLREGDEKRDRETV